MKRISLLLFLCACVNLEKPRAYRCEATNDCVEPWVCLRDNYCHDPDVGIDVACDSAADCVGGWYCARDGRCHDPNKPVPLACDDDTQCGTGWFCSVDGLCRDRAVGAPLPCDVDAHCAGGWRCSTERVCIDFSSEPTTPSATPLLLPTRVSPLLPLASRLHASPPSALPLRSEYQALFELPDGGTLRQRVEVALTGEPRQVTQTLTWLALAASPKDVEASGEYLMVLDSSNAVWLHTNTQVEPFDAGAHVTGIKPFQRRTGAPDFVLIREGTSALVVTPGGVPSEVGSGAVRDLAYVHDETFFVPERFVVVSKDDASGISTVVDWRGKGMEEVLWALPASEGSAEEVRANGARGAVKVQGPGFQATWSVRSFQLSDDGPLLDADVGCSGATLAEFMTTLSGELDVLCLTSLENGYVWRRAESTQQLSPVRAFPSLLTSVISEGSVRQLRDGQTRFGDLVSDLPSVLDGYPENIGVLGDALATVREGSVFRVAPMGLTLSMLVRDAGAPHPVGFVEGARATVWSSGQVVANDVDGGTAGYLWAFEGAPRLSAPIARVVPTAESSVLVLTDGDTVFAGAGADGGVSVVKQTARPAPGFAVTSWVAGASETGLVEGWATANNRLFKLSANSVHRWKVTEVPVSGRDPLSVFFHGEAVRLGTSTGEVLALPSRVSVAPAFNESVTSMESARGVVLASTEDDGVFQLIDGAWVEVPGTRELVGPLVKKFEERLFVVSETGVVLEL